MSLETRLEGPNGPHFRHSSLISIFECHVCAKLGRGLLTGPCGVAGKEAAREAQNRGLGYCCVAGLARSGPGAPERPSCLYLSRIGPQPGSGPPVVLPRRTARVPRSLLGADVHTRSRLGVPNLHARAQRQPALEASNTKTARFGARTLRLLLPEVCRSRHAQEVRNKPHFRSRSRILISERSVCADGRGGRHEAAKHGRSKPCNQRWIDFLRSTGVCHTVRRVLDEIDRGDDFSRSARKMEDKS